MNVLCTFRLLWDEKTSRRALSSIAAQQESLSARDSSENIDFGQNPFPDPSPSSTGEPRFVKAYIASIGKKDIIFGHTWLKLENPKIDWKTGRVELNHQWTRDETRAWKMDLYQRQVARLELKKAITTPLPEPTEDEFVVIPTSEHAILPEQKTSGAAGYNISAAHHLIIPARRRGLVGTDLIMAIPKGHYGRIAPRSSLALKEIDVAAGVIDSDY
ncbi:hypothetical protein IEO21_10858 [Rhodonia placenta]|uniref:Deoxyuridine 5'-triphosphate nucleotidohydrolase n=1 Tax=Rhodonia placenta TaxID=104341 RepID=A0A8H7NRN5_9APHY|nr:hypothetical protein IEO21_10858 [Postia placenta]